jgi:hypothetical protein
MGARKALLFFALNKAMEKKRRKGNEKPTL